MKYISKIKENNPYFNPIVIDEWYPVLSISKNDTEFFNPKFLKKYNKVMAAFENMQQELQEASKEYVTIREMAKIIADVKDLLI